MKIKALCGGDYTQTSLSCVADFACNHELTTGIMSRKTEEKEIPKMPRLRRPPPVTLPRLPKTVQVNRRLFFLKSDFAHFKQMLIARSAGLPDPPPPPPSAAINTELILSTKAAAELGVTRRCLGYWLRNQELADVKATAKRIAL